MRLFGRAETAVLFVCTANICRSPMAEGIMRSKLQERGLRRKIRVASAGTHVAQAGHGADTRARQVCAREGVKLGRCRARQVSERDFLKFDHILAMDIRNQQWLVDNAPAALGARMSLLASWGTEENLVEIPDPYFGNLAGFDLVFEILQDSIDGFLAHLVEELHLSQ